MVIGRLFILPGEILTQSNLRRKSAEVIVVVGNEPMNKAEVSQNSEGPNIKLFQMLHGVLTQPCFKRNREH